MLKIEFPAYTPLIKTENSKEYIFDTFRKQWILLTPEEWVRQNFLNYLIVIKKYPVALIAIEKEIKLNGLKKRFDILVYQSNMQPWMVIECKEMDVPLTNKVIEQVLNYNIILQTQFAVITNGVNTCAYQLVNGKMHAIKALPTF
jgi:hypothetical protein